LHFSLRFWQGKKAKKSEVKGFVCLSTPREKETNKALSQSFVELF
jgi:hypothetical protein